MPRYDYRCDNPECQKVIEIFHSHLQDYNGQYCDSCDTGRINRCLSAVPFKVDRAPLVIRDGDGNTKDGHRG